MFARTLNLVIREYTAKYPEAADILTALATDCNTIQSSKDERIISEKLKTGEINTLAQALEIAASGKAKREHAKAEKAAERALKAAEKAAEKAREAAAAAQAKANALKAKAETAIAEVTAAETAPAEVAEEVKPATTKKK